MNVSSLRRGAAALTAAALLALTWLGLAAAQPARAVSYTEQCDISGYCPNFWGGGFTLRTFTSGVANNNILAQSLPNGFFQLRDMVHGGCIGDKSNDPANGYAQGGLTCNSTSTGTGGAVGTRFYYAGCTGSFGGRLYVNYHWRGYVGFANGDNNPVVLNAGAGSSSSLAKCLKQEG